MERVNLHDAVEFCRRLSQRTGKSYGLPSEAQWEYACRAGTTTPFHFGATAKAELANYESTTYGDGSKGTSRGQTTEVASFPENALGLHDFHANVKGFCLDHWHASFEEAPSDGSPWLDPDADEDGDGLQRGGSWNDTSRSCRSARRYNFLRDTAVGFVGFRVVCLPQYHHLVS